MDITVQDVTGNFAAATGLSASTLSHGKNLLYTVNAGDQLISQSNTINATSSGIPGLSSPRCRRVRSPSMWRRTPRKSALR